MSGSSPSNHRSESSMDLHCESPTANQKANDDDRRSGEKTPPSLSPPTPFDGHEMDYLCQATGLLSTVDNRKTEKSHETRSNSDSLSWDTIPDPPLERICHHLYNAKEGTDMAHLAMVSL
ncbi:hypothetical protein PMAYCL1PPCAC_25495, partial [Pristionchus mayeri]